MTTTQATLVLLAGVPGAGKTEALRAIRRQIPRVRVSDPEVVRDHLLRWAPWLPYTAGRPFVHTIAHIAAFIRVMRRGDPLIVHDPGTRRWSRRLLLRLARFAGHRPIAVYIDVDRDTALRGQERRGRVVRSHAFERHWDHWLELRTRILAGEELTPCERWPRTLLTSRDEVVGDLRSLLGVKDPVH